MKGQWVNGGRWKMFVELHQANAGKQRQMVDLTEVFLIQEEDGGAAVYIDGINIGIHVTESYDEIVAMMRDANNRQDLWNES